VYVIRASISSSFSSSSSSIPGSSPSSSTTGSFIGFPFSVFGYPAAIASPISMNFLFGFGIALRFRVFINLATSASRAAILSFLVASSNSRASYCQTGLSILQARDRCDAHNEETRIPKINRTPQIATVADSHMMAERQRRAYYNTDS
jgi:hypothetical protein